MKTVHRAVPARSLPSGADDSVKAVYRILDVNLNRLREALRVMEEYFRFVHTAGTDAARLKTLRHSLEEIERTIGRAELLAGRDTQSDPFASGNRDEELNRRDIEDVVTASLKRAQEAARVLEEYVKLVDRAQCPEQAKRIRFALYDFEKQIMERFTHGKEQTAGKPA